MDTDADRGFNLLTTRWLALGAAGGATLSLVISQAGIEGPWQVIALVLALLALFATSAVAVAVHRRENALRAHAERHRQGQVEISALQVEIDRHTQLESELTRAKQAAESALMAKGEFLATMSHEIRTPLNGIMPMLDLLAHTRLALDQQELLRTASASAQQLLRIVDDILDYSKLEAARLELETTGFNLRDLLQSVITLLERPAESKGLRLSLQIDPGVRLPVRGDPVRLRQILSNLLSNAIKFTERGSVSLDVRRVGETPAQHMLRFEVRDTGIGIDQQTQSQLFEAFTQADASTTRLYGGTGLGLAISRRIVSLMGGRIGVESSPGRGSTFWFEIPLLKIQGDMPAQGEDLHGGRVLLVTTEQRLRVRMTTQLPNWGLRITTAENTQDALERLRKARAQGEPWTFSVVLADLASIRNTAVALARNLERKAQFGDVRLVFMRNDGDPLPDLPASALVIQRNAADADLRAALSASGVSWAHRDPHPAPQPQEVDPDPHRKPKILLVEDNPVNLMVAQRLLQVLGAECEAAGNGQIALDMLSESDFDLVLMDCQMPILDGYSATRRWREREEQAGTGRRLPIVAMTANAMAGDRQRCLDAGMDDYLAKPVTRAELEQCIARWRNVGRAPAARVEMSEGEMQQDPGTQPARTTAQPATAPPLDATVLAELEDLLGAEVHRIIAVYLEDAPRLVAQLERAAADDDPIALRVAAHTLKSSSANIGASGLADASRDIEHQARDGRLVQPVQAVAKITDEYARVRSALLERQRTRQP